MRYEKNQIDKIEVTMTEHELDVLRHTGELKLVAPDIVIILKKY